MRTSLLIEEDMVGNDVVACELFKKKRWSFWHCRRRREKVVIMFRVRIESRSGEGEL